MSPSLVYYCQQSYNCSELSSSRLHLPRAVVTCYFDRFTILSIPPSLLQCGHLSFSINFVLLSMQTFCVIQQINTSMQCDL